METLLFKTSLDILAMPYSYAWLNCIITVLLTKNKAWVIFTTYGLETQDVISSERADVLLRKLLFNACKFLSHDLLNSVK